MPATTTLLGLVTPTQGTLSGTWGDTVNYGITDYVDIAIAGTLSFSGDGAVTLANTTGSASGNSIGSTTAQYMVIRITGTQTVTKVITGPSYSKLYMVDHAGATSAVTFKAAGQSGVSIAVGEKCFVYYNGTDYIKISGSVSTGVTSFTAGSTGFTPSTATSGAVTLSGTLATANGGTNLTSFTSGGAVYATSTSALTTGTLPLASGGTAATSAPAAMASLMGFTSTATAAGTTTLTNTSSYYQQFTGTNIQTVTLPVTSTLVTGWTFHIVNNSTGNVTVNSSGANLVITVLPGTTAMCTCVGTTLTTAADWESGLTDFSTATGTGSVVLATSPTLVTPALGTPSQGVLSSCTVDGTNSVGYLTIPFNSQSAAYTAVLADSGKVIFHPSTDANARTFTIPANGSVAYPIGTALTFINMTSQVVTIAITTDTMYLSSAGTTGSRSLAQYGSATAIKMTSTTWLISGSGLT